MRPDEDCLKSLTDGTFRRIDVAKTDWTGSAEADRGALRLLPQCAQHHARRAALHSSRVRQVRQHVGELHGQVGRLPQQGRLAGQLEDAQLGVEQVLAVAAAPRPVGAGARAHAPDHDSVQVARGAQHVAAQVRARAHAHEEEAVGVGGERTHRTRHEVGGGAPTQSCARRSASNGTASKHIFKLWGLS